nr:immunoglobulin light chain junction region [Macaca mulatta]
CQHYYGTPDSF